MKGATMILFLMTLFVTTSGANEFTQHTVPTPEMVCKKIDYSSYFVAQNSESSIKQTNPDVSKPNFAGQYIILKNPLLLETVWLIADCKTGKIFHEKISARNLQFKNNSTLVIAENDRAASELFLWSEDSWDKLDEMPSDAPVSTTPSAESKDKTTVPPPSGATASAPVMQKSMLEHYDAFFKKFPTPVSTTACKPLDFDSYFKAQQEKTGILKLNKELGHANFAGHYLLVKSEIMFDTLWYIADCETGKFLPEFISGKAIFKPESATVLLKQSKDYPEIKLWQDSQWYQLADTTQKNHPAVKNTLTGQKAKTLADALSVTPKNQKIQFEKIECGPSGCTVDRFKQPGLAIDASHTVALGELIHIFGPEAQEGACEIKSNEPQCLLNSK
jgi:hypothetical protein